jgi:hypothetical protein
MLLMLLKVFVFILAYFGVKFSRRQVSVICTSMFSLHCRSFRFTFIYLYNSCLDRNTKSSSFRDITPYSPLKTNRRFGGTCRLHLQGRRIKTIKKTRAKHVGSIALLRIGFMLGLFFDPDDGGHMFFRNVC